MNVVNQEPSEAEVVSSTINQPNQEPSTEAETGDKPNAILVSIELAQALVNYLSEQPLKDVESLVNAIRESRGVTVTEEKPEA
jgi:hypothetical protein